MVEKGRRRKRREEGREGGGGGRREGEKERETLSQIIRCGEEAGTHRE